MVLIVNPMGSQLALPLNHSKSNNKPKKVVKSVDGKGISELVNKLKEVKVKNDDLKDIRITL